MKRGLLYIALHTEGPEDGQWAMFKFDHNAKCLLAHLYTTKAELKKARSMTLTGWATARVLKYSKKPIKSPKHAMSGDLAEKAFANYGYGYVLLETVKA